MARCLTKQRFDPLQRRSEVLRSNINIGVNETSIFIYCIRNKINGLRYIGQDSAPIEKLARAKTHFTLANLLSLEVPQ